LYHYISFFRGSHCEKLIPQGGAALYLSAGISGMYVREAFFGKRIDQKAGSAF
jgi:hypothetical protein